MSFSKIMANNCFHKFSDRSTVSFNVHTFVGNYDRTNNRQTNQQTDWKLEKSNFRKWNWNFCKSHITHLETSLPLLPPPPPQKTCLLRPILTNIWYIKLIKSSVCGPFRQHNNPYTHTNTPEHIHIHTNTQKHTMCVCVCIYMHIQTLT